jgi:uncharacterized protein YjbI with pentapeptide repeats
MANPKFPSAACALAAVLVLAAVPADAQEATCRVQREAKCAGANLEGRDLRGANLRNADMKGAKLRGANMAGADLGGTDLTGADMRFANLGGAALFGTKLTNADLTGAGLRFSDLKPDTELSGTIMPDGKRCTPPSVGDCKNPTMPPKR